MTEDAATELLANLQAWIENALEEVKYRLMGRDPNADIIGYVEIPERQLRRNLHAIRIAREGVDREREAPEFHG